MSDNEVRDVSAGSAWLVAALGSTPIGKTKAGEDVVNWLGNEVQALPEAEVFVTVDGALGELRGLVIGPTLTMLEALGEHLGTVDAGQADVARVRELGESIEPESLGLWAEARPEGLAIGWSFHGQLAAGPVVAAMPDNEAHKAVVEVVEGLGLEKVSELRASVATEQGGTFCRWPVEREVVKVVRAIAETFGVEPFADEVVALLGGSVEVVVGLNGEGVCGFGVSTDDVTEATLVELVKAMGGDGHGDGAALKAFEGRLGATARDAMVWLDGAGVRALFTYRVRSDGR